MSDSGHGSRVDELQNSGQPIEAHELTEAYEQECEMSDSGHGSRVDELQNVWMSIEAHELIEQYKKQLGTHKSILACSMFMNFVLYCTSIVPLFSLQTATEQELKSCQSQVLSQTMEPNQTMEQKFEILVSRNVPTSWMRMFLMLYEDPTLLATAIIYCTVAHLVCKLWPFVLTKCVLRSVPGAFDTLSEDELKDVHNTKVKPMIQQAIKLFITRSVFSTNQAIQQMQATLPARKWPSMEPSPLLHFLYGYVFLFMALCGTAVFASQELSVPRDKAGREQMMKNLWQKVDVCLYMPMHFVSLLMTPFSVVGVSMLFALKWDADTLFKFFTLLVSQIFIEALGMALDDFVRRFAFFFDIIKVKGLSMGEFLRDVFGILVVAAQIIPGHIVGLELIHPLNENTTFPDLRWSKGDQLCIVVLVVVLPMILGCAWRHVIREVLTHLSLSRALAGQCPISIRPVSNKSIRLFNNGGIDIALGPTRISVLHKGLDDTSTELVDLKTTCTHVLQAGQDCIVPVEWQRKVVSGDQLKKLRGFSIKKLSWRAELKTGLLIHDYFGLPCLGGSISTEGDIKQFKQLLFDDAQRYLDDAVDGVAMGVEVVSQVSELFSNVGATLMEDSVKKVEKYTANPRIQEFREWMSNGTRWIRNASQTAHGAGVASDGMANTPQDEPPALQQHTRRAVQSPNTEEVPALSAANFDLLDLQEFHAWQQFPPSAPPFVDRGDLMNLQMHGAGDPSLATSFLSTARASPSTAQALKESPASQQQVASVFGEQAAPAAVATAMPDVDTHS